MEERKGDDGIVGCGGWVLAGQCQMMGFEIGQAGKGIL